MLSGVPLRPVNPIPRFAAMKRTIRRRLCCLLPALMTAGAIAATPPRRHAAESGIARDFEWCSVAAPASLPPEARCTSPSRSTGMSTRKTSSLPATCTGCVPTAHGADFSPGHRAEGRSGQTAPVPPPSQRQTGIDGRHSADCVSLSRRRFQAAHTHPQPSGHPYRRPGKIRESRCATALPSAPGDRHAPQEFSAHPAAGRPHHERRALHGPRRIPPRSVRHLG